jgi:hypothetical protein
MQAIVRCVATSSLPAKARMLRKQILPGQTLPQQLVLLRAEAVDSLLLARLWRVRLTRAHRIKDSVARQKEATTKTLSLL